MIRSVPYAARRVRQTLTALDNGPAVLAAIGSHRVLGRPRDVQFRLPGPRRVLSPNRPGARMPVYEVMVDDSYRLATFTADIGPAPVAVDIGAHVGSFTLAFTRLHPDAQVFAFEASPSTASYLLRNVAANGLSGKVHVDARAVSAQTGQIQFEDNGGGSGHNGMTSPEETTTLVVDAVAFSDVISAAGPRVDILKIDAEGAEYGIFLDSPIDALAPVQRVVMEYHPLPGYSWEDLETHFKKAGLTVVRREPIREGLGLAWFSRDPVG